MRSCRHVDRAEVDSCALAREPTDVPAPGCTLTLEPALDLAKRNDPTNYRETQAPYDAGIGYLFERGEKRQHRLDAANVSPSCRPGVFASIFRPGRRARRLRRGRNSGIRISSPTLGCQQVGTVSQRLPGLLQITLVVRMNYLFTGALAFVCVLHVSENSLLGGLSSLLQARCRILARFPGRRPQLPLHGTRLSASAGPTT